MNSRRISKQDWYLNSNYTRLVKFLKFELTRQSNYIVRLIIITTGSSYEMFCLSYEHFEYENLLLL